MGGQVGKGNRFVHGIVRKTAFVGKELTAVRRQPRLLLSLVLGPFLILLLFGLGYQATQRDIRTIVVFPQDMQVSLDPEQYRDAFVQTNELNKRILTEALKRASRNRTGQEATADQTRNRAQTISNAVRIL